MKDYGLFRLLWLRSYGKPDTSKQADKELDRRGWNL